MKFTILIEFFSDRDKNMWPQKMLEITNVFAFGTIVGEEYFFATTTTDRELNYKIPVKDIQVLSIFKES